MYITGADPGFPVGGGANPLEGRQQMILPLFAKNCMKLRTFWAVGGHLPAAPLIRHCITQVYLSVESLAVALGGSGAVGEGGRDHLNYYIFRIVQ